MAVASSVLERNTLLQEAEDKRHNDAIKLRYAMLINPENNLKDLKQADYNNMSEDNSACYAQEEEYAAADYSRPVAQVADVVEEQPVNTYYARPQFVESARTDSEIFRADSVVNRLEEANEVQAEVMQAEEEEEENEDLRPTSTTIQYQTAAKMRVEEGSVVNISSNAEKRSSLSKRDKITIAVIVSVIVALFVLIIVNSAIITNINRDLGTLQVSLNSAKMAYQGVSGQVSEFSAGLENAVTDLAQRLGMVK